MMPSPSLLSVHVGKVAPLGPEQVPSGFIKRSVSGTVAVKPLGLAGDEQADLTVHGGPEKAVYGYAASHYPAWQKEFPALAAALLPGCTTPFDSARPMIHIVTVPPSKHWFI